MSNSKKSIKSMQSFKSSDVPSTASRRKVGGPSLTGVRLRSGRIVTSGQETSFRENSKRFSQESGVTSLQRADVETAAANVAALSLAGGSATHAPSVLQGVRTMAAATSEVNDFEVLLDSLLLYFESGSDVTTRLRGMSDVELGELEDILEMVPASGPTRRGAILGAMRRHGLLIEVDGKCRLRPVDNVAGLDGALFTDHFTS